MWIKRRKIAQLKLHRNNNSTLQQSSYECWWIHKGPLSLR
ncbi:rCG59067 [Rattus norvegicus]|uniref:RCG59067 n=1 Tax=Rattus norvegicus TaxID=10116 RepID=A6JPS7_RAT|nr:rCG59067 [Rattus norvegicus]